MSQDGPLVRVPVSTFNRRADELVSQIDAGRLELNPPYQRGAVWTPDQQVGLIYSLLCGIPVPSLLINARPLDTSGPAYVVVDGKQRLLTVHGFFASQIAVPRAWFGTDMVSSGLPAGPSAQVTFAQLNARGRALASRMVLPVGETSLATVAEEAALFVLVNGAGTAQTAETLREAARIAGL